MILLMFYTYTATGKTFRYLKGEVTKVEVDSTWWTEHPCHLGLAESMIRIITNIVGRGFELHI